jgi:hypothetical protein
MPAPRWSAKFEYLHSDFGSVGFVPVVSNTLINATNSASSEPTSLAA